MRTPVIVGLMLVCACKGKVERPSVPPAIAAPAGESVVLRASTVDGKQNYECRAGAWVLVAPDAKLLDDSGAELGRHYAGPTWEAKDGSKVVGEVKARADAPAAGAVPWLLLSAKSHEGTGALANVTSIQRVDTSGGVAPKDGCDEKSAGAKTSVAYKATYYFYRVTP